ncbi:hypothetical protein [Prochlorococcus marinus]|uniref:hypothetical protein n=1 Tax=Prochlorococcus marinus TaxID=1219 RepID=UPI0023A9A602|nr:hypothetical protein [Prochlorococcus marinus]
MFSRFVDSENWEVRQAIALNPQTPSDVIEQLRDDDDSDVQEAVLNRQLPVDWRQLDEAEKIEKLQEENVGPDILKAFAKSSNWRIRAAVASNENTPEDVLKQLAKDDDSDVQEAALNAVAYRELPKEWRELDDDEKLDKLKEDNVPTNILEILAQSSNWEIRKAIALHENTPEEVIQQLAKDDDSDVQEAVLNRQLPVDWRQLDEDEKLEKINNQNVSEEVLTILAQFKSWNYTQIRAAVASNENTPEDVLKQLAKDDDSDVQEAVLNRQLPVDWRQLDEDEKLEKINNQNVSEEVLTILAQFKSWNYTQIRAAVASNENTPEDVLKQLAKDDASDVQEAVLNRQLPVDWRQLDEDEKLEKINNQNVSEEVLTILAQFKSWNYTQIRAAVASNENTPEDVLKQLAKEGESEITEAILQRQLPSDWQKLDENQKLERLKREKVSEEVLVIFSNSTKPLLRKAAGSNKNASLAILAQLNDDGDSKQRAWKYILRNWGN